MTDAGVEVMDRSVDIQGAVEKRFVGALSKGELRKLNELLRTLVLEIEDAKAAVSPALTP